MTVRPADLLPNAEFVSQRPWLERAAIENASVRRIKVGDHLLFLFENRVSVTWQVQEMCRVESISSPAAIQHELDTYNALLPSVAADGSAELSATLMIQYTDEQERDIALHALVGMHEHVYIEIAGERYPARFDNEQFNDTRVSAVQFVRFPLPAKARREFGDLSKPAALVCTHPALSDRATISPVCRGALIGDLEG